LQEEGLARENNKRVKAITRFEADYLNELWQTDWMVRVLLPPTHLTELHDRYQ